MNWNEVKGSVAIGSKFEFQDTSGRVLKAIVTSFNWFGGLTLECTNYPHNLTCFYYDVDEGCKIQRGYFHNVTGNINQQQFVPLDSPEAFLHPYTDN